MKKQNFLLLILFIVFFISCKKEGYTITGHVTGYKDGTRIKLIPFEQPDSEQYTTVEKNSFVFKGYIPNVAERFSLMIDNGRSTIPDGFAIFIGNENVVITADKQHFSNFKITGSKHQDILNKVYKQWAAFEPESRRLTEEYIMLKRSNDNKDSIKEIYLGKNGKLKKYEILRDSIYKNFIRENYNSYPALQQLIFDRDNFDKQEIVSIYGKLKPEYKNSRFGKAIKAFIDKPQLREGDTAYDFEATDSNGKKYKLYDYLNKNKYILLEFTQPKCGHSKATIPVLQEINKEQSKKLQIVSVTIKDKENWEKQNKKSKITYTRLFNNENGWLGKTVIEYDVDGTPAFFLLSSKGKIMKKFNGFNDNMKKEVYSLLQ